MNWAATVYVALILLGAVAGVRHLTLGRPAMAPLKGGAAVAGVLIYLGWVAFTLWLFVTAVNY